MACQECRPVPDRACAWQACLGGTGKYVFGENQEMRCWLEGPSYIRWSVPRSSLLTN